MPLHKPSVGQRERRERICVMGTAGSGKTRAWLSIAELARKTKSDATFYVIDTDLALEAMLDGFPRLAESDTLVVREAMEYNEMLEAALEFKKRAKRGDWIICDMISAEWDAVQAEYVARVFGGTKSDYFLTRRIELEEQNVAARETKGKREKKTFQPFEGYIDWPVVKAMHVDFMNAVVLNNRAHVFATAEAKALNRGSKGGDEKGVIDQFAHLGARPAGEKRMSHLFHTVHLLKRSDDETWQMTAGKDRERKEAHRVDLGPDHGQFVKRYLMDIAGWKLT